MAQTQDEYMRSLAAALDDLLNPGLKGDKRKIGFALLTYDFDAGPKDGRVNYIGNGQRDDVRVAMKEVIARWEGRYAETTAKQ
jgi:hypothetical protein